MQPHPMPWPLRFGIFMAPFHAPGTNPTLALERDLELVTWLDRLGFDEVWIGEHHSAGVEIIASPEIFIAAAAERTRRIRLGTGVTSLPYHHPFHVADRMVLLDHLTRGRVMLGVGPGQLATDAAMLGIESSEQRHRMEEALEVILDLLAGKTVTRDAGWFTLTDASLQLRPFSQPRFDVAVAASISPSGPRAAGRFGLGLLSIGATMQAGFDLLAHHWGVVQERAAEYGSAVDRQGWRLVGPMHLADTESQARADVAHGLLPFLHYFNSILPSPLAPDATTVDEAVDAVNASGWAVIGTPDQAAEQIGRLVSQSDGGFGAFLVMAHEWADREATLRSYELLARDVMPQFQGSLDAPLAWWERAHADREQIKGTTATAIAAAIAEHAAEKEDLSG